MLREIRKHKANILIPFFNTSIRCYYDPSSNIEATKFFNKTIGLIIPLASRLPSRLFAFNLGPILLA